MTDLVASQDFTNLGAAVSGTVTNGTPSTPPVTQSVVTTDPAPISIHYDAPSNSYTITADGRTQTYGPAQAGPGTKDLDFYQQGPNDAFTLYKTAASTSLALTYTRYGGWSAAGATGNQLDFHDVYFVFGIPTAPADMPRTGTANYAGRALATWASPQTFISQKGIVLFTADFGASTINVHIELGSSSDFKAGPADFGILNGTGTIDSASASFAGTVSGNGYSGPLKGLFFGPKAVEMGGTFAARNSSGFSVTGVIAGRQN
ncbi:MAG TPA: transferrin-binding protein-like solute binding protein [Allosphingosinicella sp.]|jgi:hypothetical protein|nr:transferrin-binding protein-like solute binding protein [Allosphingosinicella sp.]